MAGVLGKTTKDQWAAMQNARRRKRRRAVAPEPPVPPAGYSVLPHDVRYGSVVTEATAVTLGTAFANSAQGKYTHVCFFKDGGDATVARQVALYNLEGGLLASGSTEAEPPGPVWLEVQLNTPVSRSGGDPIDFDVIESWGVVAAVHFPLGRYSAEAGKLTNRITKNALVALANAEKTNGVFKYGAAIAYPDGDFGQTFYNVDVIFVPNEA